MKQNRTRGVALAAVISTALAIAAPGTAHSGSELSGDWITCTERATLNFSPGLTLTPQPVSMLASDTITDCKSSDPTITSGTAVVQATSPAANCAGGRLTGGLATIEWDNGETTILRFEGGFAAGVAAARGRVIDGTAFVGRPFKASDSVDDPGPVLGGACLAPEGLGSVSVTGQIVIGNPPLD